MAKLVEILARELVEWPDDTPCITQDPDGYSLGMLQDELGDLKFDERLGEWIGICAGFMEIMELSEDHRTAIVTRAEWQAAVDALKAKEVVEWDGVGLPPVGASCERRFPDVRESSWNGCIILAHGARKIFVRDNCGDEWAHHLDDVEFRPFRTPEQIAAEERESAINGMLAHDALSGSRRGLAAALYDAGYRKQEPK